MTHIFRVKEWDRGLIHNPCDLRSVTHNLIVQPKVMLQSCRERSFSLVLLSERLSQIQFNALLLWTHQTKPLKTVDTIGSCQRLLFTVGVSQHMHKITKRWKFELSRPLNTEDTIGSCQRLLFTVGVPQHMHKITKLWNFELNRPSKWRDNKWKKHPLSLEVVCFMLYFETYLRSRNQIRGQIISFSQTTSLQREPFLTMFYLINLSPLLVTK